MSDSRRTKAATIIPSNINSKHFRKDPVLASIADMVDAENNTHNRGQRQQGGHRGPRDNQDQGDDRVLMDKIDAILDRKLAPIYHKLHELERSHEVFRNQFQCLNLEARQAIDQQGEAIHQLMTDVIYLKNRDNNIEQRDRDPGQRIDNFPVPENISPLELQDKIYNDLYKPMFIQAAKDGILPKREVLNLDQLDDKGEPTITTTTVDLPLPGEVIEYCHTLSGGRPANLPVGAQPRRAARTPTIIVKLRGRNTKEIITKYKKAGLVNFNKNKAKKDSVFINDDLTKTNLFCLNKLKRSEGVCDAFFLGGKVRFSLKSNPSKNHTVLNAFGNDLEQLTRRPLNPLMM